MAEKQLYLHTSNRVEKLAARLVDVSQALPLAHTLSQETVMTLNPGIARWLQFEIAKRTGVAFGWDFPLPGKLFSRVLRGFEPSFDATGAFPEDQARWRLLDLLGNLEDQARFAQVRSYCQNAVGTRRLAFANRLAKLYDEYLVYRPDIVTRWEDEPSESHFDWQAELWRRLIRKLYPRIKTPRHIARLWQDLSRGQILELGIQPQFWPERLFVFGVSSLAPLYLDLLDQLSRYRPVHVFLLQPSDQYWADLKSSKQIQKIAQKAARKAGARLSQPEDWLFETGNPLLPSLGKQSQMFLDLLIDKDPQQDDSQFEEPDETQSQLHCLQADLFTIEDRDLAKGTPPFPPYDASIQLHSCSSRRREVETIWDLIVERLDSTPELKASDILVMAPDIQDYRSHIEAVFKAKRGTPFDIPYSIADSAAGSRPGVLSGLFAILQSVSTRASSAEVLALLETPLLREVFSFSDRDLECIEFWIRELGITWGWDAEHRSQHLSFATDRNTWRELRIRLLSGALFSQETLTPQGILSYPEIESDLAETAGRLLECLELIRSLRQGFHQTHSIASWQERLLGLLGSVRCDRDEWQRDYQQAGELIRETLPELADSFASGAEVYRALAEKFESSASGGGYLSGGVTFCSLKPMRAIPADTVCLMGMNRSDFPRSSKRPSFDLMANETRIGDRNTRDEDRQFFLETLLSVRSRLVISYQGLSPNSDTLNEPSAVVEELLSYLQNAMEEEDFEQIFRQQKRQSFDPSYFHGETQTYDPERAKLRNRFRPTAQPSEPTPQREAANSEAEAENPSLVELEDLIRFMESPSKAFATKVAKLRMESGDDALPEMDPLFSTGLDRFKLRHSFAAQIASGGSLDEIDFRSLAQSKFLPAGFLEKPSFQAEYERAQQVAEAIGEQRRESVYLEAPCGPASLCGESQTQAGRGDQLIVEAGELKPKRVIAAWIRHLFASAYNPAFRGETVVLSLHHKGGHFRFAKTEGARERLGELLQLFLDGEKAPIPFFPELSEKTCKAWQKLGGEDEALRIETALGNARRDVRSSLTDTASWKKVEWSDYDRICFGDDYAPDQRFLDLALQVWEPCLAAKQPLKLASMKGGEA
ncbi:exodeoxyribonuclease V subunit gamma [Pelagicoccus sp. SDUM812005]|uniref:exodeoxyribonuclease V subunit gamma n=1 Tax=Pelagicoccus sp. SDUM812005 TaxID=3041257 RepID=UPI00280C68A4|nr:exodeoxyribonuclease V subunit gamma [Pelagicoccus sp. SDUM812005]MDQ8183758.1 exodeoxyribonuclease V subunit gamma [Pelagicoccus sp. SDUM812005]